MRIHAPIDWLFKSCEGKKVHGFARFYKLAPPEWPLYRHKKRRRDATQIGGLTGKVSENSTDVLATS
jgi:hypothetical protein